MGRTSDAKDRLMEAVRNLIWSGSYGSTTIDLICEKAGVKKGSFYYFFPSKAELAMAALEADWETRRAGLDSIFSPTVPPLERLRRYCEHVFRKQADIKAQCGCVLGCPLFTLGAEISTQEQLLRRKVQEILEQHRRYLESAIRDAHACGLIHAPDAGAAARLLLAYHEGLLTQARIHNDANVLREMLGGTLSVLGVKSLESAPAARA